MNMKISIGVGILAWNEEDSVHSSLHSLLKQDVFEQVVAAGGRVEITCVPNGCSDGTAEAMRNTLMEEVPESWSEGVEWKVVELSEAGKINALMEYVHNLSRPGLDYIFMMDADIHIVEKEAFSNMLATLQSNSHAFAATDTPLKHIHFKEDKNVFDRISLAMSHMTKTAPGQLTGQLYCARGEFMRAVHIPRGIIVEDGFLKLMAVSNFMTEDADNTRIVPAEKASAIFQAYTGLGELFLNQRRQAVGYAIHVYLREHLERNAAGKHAGDFIAAMNTKDPDWFVKLVMDRVRNSGLWVMPIGGLLARFKRLKHYDPARRIVKLPVACAGFVVDLLVYTSANYLLKKGRVQGIWQDTKTTIAPGSE